MPKTLTEKDKKCLSRIKANFGQLFRQAGELYDFRPSVLGGICMRESKGGEILDKNGLGDKGHGHGLFQIDDRSFPDFCSDHARCLNPLTNTLMACKVLRDIRVQVKRECVQFKVDYTPLQLERMILAGYNGGADHAVHALRHGEDQDTYTTGKDYSAAVELFAVFYELDPTPEGEEGTKHHNNGDKV